jgi:molybdenum-dependent DNA-binding transcriptional regulator ModE
MAKSIEADVLLTSFSDFLKKLITSYRALKKRVKALMDIKEEQIQANKNIIGMAGRFEERSFAYMSEVPQTKPTLR